MRLETITESTSEVLELEPEQAEALNQIGRRLASDKRWWGASETGDEGRRERSVIRCRARGPGRYQVRVFDAVGVVSTGDLQIRVRPKIPTRHLLFLFAASGHFPRLDPHKAVLEEGEDFHELIARWFITAAESVLRRDLIKDYSRAHGFLRAKRGRINATPTARAFYAGRIGFDCEYDIFDTDTSLNRILFGAATVVARRPELEWPLRKRARAVMSRMDEVGPVRVDDFRVRLDRRSAHYADALPLGTQVLRWEGRFLEHGGQAAWSFLIRTPEMVEDGLRNLIRKQLGDRWKIEKRGIQLEGSKLTFTPDLVFDDGEVVADVKYKQQRPDWNRGDLYQIVAFAEAYRATRGIVISFRSPDRVPLPDATVGRIAVTSATWKADPDLSPEEAAADLVFPLERSLREA